MCGRIDAFARRHINEIEMALVALSTVVAWVEIVLKQCGKLEEYFDEVLMVLICVWWFEVVMNIYLTFIRQFERQNYVILYYTTHRIMILIEAFIIFCYKIIIKNDAEKYSIIIFLDSNFLGLICDADMF